MNIPEITHFRVWDIKEKKLTSNGSFLLDDCGNLYERTLEEETINGINQYSYITHHGFKEVDKNDYIITFRTGFNDKSGQWVYEGDIIAYGSRKYLIKYDKINCNSCKGNFTFGYRYRNENKIIIIGNIFETPELLGE